MQKYNHVHDFICRFRFKVNLTYCHRGIVADNPHSMNESHGQLLLQGVMYNLPLQQGYHLAAGFVRIRFDVVQRIRELFLKIKNPVHKSASMFLL